jgi:hypothetical protein
MGNIWKIYEREREGAIETFLSNSDHALENFSERYKSYINFLNIYYKKK